MSANQGPYRPMPCPACGHKDTPAVDSRGRLWSRCHGAPMTPSAPMRVSDLRALLAGVSDDAFVVIRDDDGHGSPESWYVHESTVGEPQQVVLVTDTKGS